MVICQLVLLVINVFAHNAYGQSTIKQDTEDYILLNKFLMSERAFLLDKPVYLILENDNSSVIEFFNVLREVELTLDAKKIDSVKERYWIKEPSVIVKIKEDNDTSSQEEIDAFYKFDSIFNLKDYDYLISQIHQGKWNIKRINPEIILGDERDSHRYIRYSKPIYTRDGRWAFIQYNSPTASSILVYLLNEERWEKYKEMNFYLLSPRIKKEKIDKY